VVAVLRGAAAGTVVLDAHTDTVPPGDAAAWVRGDPYCAADAEVVWLGDDRVRLLVDGALAAERPIRRRMGRVWEARAFDRAPAIYGRGAFDNKGPVAVAWLATVALARALDGLGVRLGGNLVAGFTIDEEDGMAGVRAFTGGPGCWLDRAGLLSPAPADGGYRPNAWGVALDGSYGFVPVVGHRGIAQLLVRTAGQASHAATPQLGVNAVTRMAAILHALDGHPDDVAAALSPLFADRLLEPASLAVGTTIVGGGVRAVGAGDGGRTVERGAINVVPDWCEATIDCRHPRPVGPGQSEIRARVAQAVAQVAARLSGVAPESFDISVLGGGPPCAILDDPADGAADRLVGAVLRHGAAVSGFAPWVETAPGGTDATVMINEGRIRSIVEFGPAGGFAHEPHEFVERDQIAVGARILARTIVDLLGVVPRS
jgi:acetylornithine deacetylase/succinyl-diaminopimelate desuccinylase-like protein